MNKGYVLDLTQNPTRMPRASAHTVEPGRSWLKSQLHTDSGWDVEQGSPLKAPLLHLWSITVCNSVSVCIRCIRCNSMYLAWMFWEGLSEIAYQAYRRFISQQPGVAPVMTAVPKAFRHQGLVLWKIMFPQTGEWGRDGLGMIQEHYTYCVLYFYYHYISSTSDHQTLDPRGWGSLSDGTPAVRVLGGRQPGFWDTGHFQERGVQTRLKTAREEHRELEKCSSRSAWRTSPWADFTQHIPAVVWRSQGHRVTRCTSLLSRNTPHLPAKNSSSPPPRPQVSRHQSTWWAGPVSGLLRFHLTKHWHHNHLLFSSLPTSVIPRNLIELASPWLTDKTTNHRP